MAKGKYQEWLEPDNLILLKGWAREGLTDEQIAEKMGIGTTTLYRWKEEHREIRESLKKSKDVVDFEVENALLKAAMSGNVTAQIYWLNNRKSDRWRNKQKEATDTSQLDKLDKILDEIKDKAKKDVDNAAHD